MPTMQGFNWPKWLKETETSLWHIQQSLEREQRSPTKKEREYASQMWEMSQGTDTNGDYVIPEQYWGDAELIYKLGKRIYYWERYIARR